jgi:acetyl esterase/lipase
MRWLTGLVVLGLITSLFGLAFSRRKAQEEPPLALPLWQQGAPGAKGSQPADKPFIAVYRPPVEKANGAAVVICPGGGYGSLAPHEAEPVAKWLNSLGVTGIVLTYRLGPRYHHPAMLEDAARAIRLTRAHAPQWGLDAKRIGILGFSAGGHLASTVATHFDPGDPAAADPIDRESSRPDIAILIYPVITMSGPYAHAGSRNNLLGTNPAPELVELLSNERQVTPQTPPVFLVHTAEDTVVPLENSLLFALACRKAGVPVAMQVYEKGEHGFGLGGQDPILSTWPAQCAAWMRSRGFLR